MDSTEKSIDEMITDIKKKLQLVNQDMIRAENYSTGQYDELRDIHELVMSKASISVSEMEAILTELGNIRDK